MNSIESWKDLTSIKDVCSIKSENGKHRFTIFLYDGSKWIFQTNDYTYCNQVRDKLIKMKDDETNKPK